MKRILPLFLLSLLFGACGKEEPKGEPAPLTYQQKLKGEWVLDSVYYDGSAPNPLNPTSPIEFEGAGEAVAGGHTVTNNPDRLEYDYAFRAEVEFGGQVIPVPINRTGEGELTVNGSGTKLFITEPERTTVWDVLVNEQNRQVYAGEVQETYLNFVITTDVELYFSRK